MSRGEVCVWPWWDGEKTVTQVLPSTLCLLEDTSLMCWGYAAIQFLNVPPVYQSLIQRRWTRWSLKGILATTACSIVNSRCFLLKLYVSASSSAKWPLQGCWETRVTSTEKFLGYNPRTWTIRVISAHDYHMLWCSICRKHELHCLHLRQVSACMSFCPYDLKVTLWKAILKRSYVIVKDGLMLCGLVMLKYALRMSLTYIFHSVGGSSLKTNPLWSQQCIFDDIL